ncbi:DNA primase family protein [Pseudomonas fluorescens group sp. PF-69]
MNAQLAPDIFQGLSALPIWMPHANKTPNNGLGRLSKSVPEHWMTRAEAQQLVAQYQDSEILDNRLTGVGMVVVNTTVIDGQRLIIIDADGIVGAYTGVYEEKVLDPVGAADALPAFALMNQIPTYWEASPSGTGLHAYALVPDEWAAKYANAGHIAFPGCHHVEIYTGDAPQYATVTGVAVNGLPISHLDDDALALLAGLLEQAKEAKTRAANLDLGGGTPFDLTRVIGLLPKHRQMINGEIPVGQRSPIFQGLLIAVMNDHAGYTLPDIKASVLDNEHLLTYLKKHTDPVKFADSEIKGAWALSVPGRLEALTGFNSNRKVATNMTDTDSATTPEKPKTKKPAGVAPLEAKHLITDQANAVRLQNAVGGGVIHAAGKWRVWDGAYWREDEPAAFRMTCTLSDMIGAEATEWENKPYASAEEKTKNQEIAKALRKWGAKSEMLDRLNAAFNLLRRLVSVPADNLDCDLYALNVANGTVDLRTGELRPHSKDDLITRCIPIAYDPKARAPLYEKTLAEITGEVGMARKPLAEFLQRWFGYSANGVTSEQKFAVHHGDGANGKSLLFDTIGNALGPYAGTAAPGLMMAGGQNRHPTEVADLFGMRLVAAHESGEGGALNEDRIKHATGNEKMKARGMRQDFFEFSPTHTLNLLTNHKPQIRGQDMGIWRRVMLIPYGVTFGTVAEVAQGLAHHLRDDRLGEALKAEAPGILTWVVRGAVTWFQTGLRPPDAVMIASAEYRSEQDRVGQFLNERGEHYAKDWEPCDPLFRDYQTWCKDCGYFPLGKNNFIAAVEKRPGIKKEVRLIDWGNTKKQYRCFSGLKTVFGS